MYLDIGNQQEMTFDSMIFEVFIIMAIVKVNNKGSHSKIIIAEGICLESTVRYYALSYTKSIPDGLSNGLNISQGIRTNERVSSQQCVDSNF